MIRQLPYVLWIGLLCLCLPAKAQVITDFPYFENFADGPAGWTVDNMEIPNGWELGVPDAEDPFALPWEGQAWVTNLNGDYHEEFPEYYLYSPVFDFSGFEDLPKISFQLAYTIENRWDGAALEMSLDGGDTWEVVGEPDQGKNWYSSTILNFHMQSNFFNYGWTGNSVGWVEAEQIVPHAAGNNDVRFRFVFAGDGSVSDLGMAMSHFKIEDIYALDLEMLALSSSNPMGSFSDTEELKLLIKNGLSPFMGDIALTIEIYETEMFDLVGEYYVDLDDVSLASEEVKEFSLGSEFDLAQNTNYIILVFIEELDLYDPANEEKQFFLNNLIISDFPYLADFANSAQSWYFDNKQVDGWDFGVPAPGSPFALPEEGQAWVTNLNGNYHPTNPEYYLYSPVFDLSDFDDSPKISFQIAYDIELGWDGAALEMSLDGGESWQVVGEPDQGKNWYRSTMLNNPVRNDFFLYGWTGNSEGWVEAEQIVPQAAGQSNVRFRFVLAGNQFNSRQGMAMSHFQIEEIFTLDLEMLALRANSPIGDFTASEELFLKIKNNFEAFETDIPLTIKVYDTDLNDLLEEYNVTLESVSMAAGEEKEISLGAVFDLAEEINYKIHVSIEEIDLMTPTNAEKQFFLNNLIISEFPYTANFSNSTENWYFDNNGIANGWEHGIPNTQNIQPIEEFSTVWATHLNGNYHPNYPLYYLYSPVFDFSNAEHPIGLELDINFKIENRFDGAALELKINDQPWTVVGSPGEGENWYSENTLYGSGGPQGLFSHGWTGSSDGWIKASIDSLDLMGNENVQFRLTLVGDDIVSDEGIALARFVIDYSNKNAFLSDRLFLLDPAEESYFFLVSDFLNNYTSIDEVPLEGISISDLPENGELFFDDILITDPGFFVDVNDISLLEFRYGSEFKESTFKWEVSQEGLASGKASYTLRLPSVPEITPVPDQETDRNQLIQGLVFTVIDEDADYDLIEFEVFSSNPELVDEDGIYIIGIAPDQSIRIEPKENAFGESTITIVARKGPVSTEASFQLTVNFVTLRPIISEIQAEFPLNTDFTFSIAFFDEAYEDVDDNPFEKIRIVSLPLDGKLVLNDEDVTTGQEISRTDLDKLKLIHQENFVGPYSFSFNMRNNQLYALHTRLVVLNVVGEPDPELPLLSDFSVEVPFNRSYHFSLDTFLENFNTTIGEMESLRIDQLPSLGSLQLRGELVAEGQILDPLDLDDLSYVNVTHGEKDAIQWNASNPDGFAESSGTVEINLIDNAQPPVLPDFEDQTINFDNVIILRFEISDPYWPIDSLTLDLISDNPELIPDSSLNVSFFGNEVVLYYFAITLESGEGSLTLRLSNPQSFTESTFKITVVPESNVGEEDEIEDEEEEEETITHFSSTEGLKVRQNYPNPFRLNTRIPFYLPESMQVKARVINLLGIVVKDFGTLHFASGEQELEWMVSEALPKGLYLMEMEFSDFQGNGHSEVFRMIRE